jgi:hypothetical protein
MYPCLIGGHEQRRGDVVEKLKSGSMGDLFRHVVKGAGDKW